MSRKERHLFESRPCMEEMKIYKLPVVSCSSVVEVFFVLLVIKTKTILLLIQSL